MGTRAPKQLMQEIWTSEDEEALEAFELAIRRDLLGEALFAIEGVDAELRNDCQTLLGHWSNRLRHLCDDQPERAGEVIHLVALMGDELEFQGDTEDYYHPRNSFLSQVLGRRRGLPILLSSVWTLVGRGAGLDVDGVALPGHFIVRVGGPEAMLVDPFAGGRFLSENDCRALVRRASGGRLKWDRQYLSAVGTRSWLERVLRNLVGAYQRRDETDRLYRPVRFLAALRPDDPKAILLRASIADEVGAFAEAAALYGEITGRWPSSPEALIAERRLPIVESRLATMN